MHRPAACRSGRSCGNSPRPRGCRCSDAEADRRATRNFRYRDLLMSVLPEAKLDVLLAHHASLEAQLLGQLSSEKYVQITRELSELNPVIEAVKAYRAAVKELADTEALIADP